MFSQEPLLRPTEGDIMVVSNKLYNIQYTYCWLSYFSQVIDYVKDFDSFYPLPVFVKTLEIIF